MLGGGYKEPKKWLFDHQLTHSGDSLPVPHQDGEKDQFMVVGFSKDGTKLFGQAQEDDPRGRQGAIYEANLVDGVWTEVCKITASADASDDADYLGEHGIYSHGNKLFVSAVRDDDYGTRSGALFVFHSSSAGWEEVQKIYSANPEKEEEFGSDPMMTDDGQTLICSAIWGETEGSSYNNSGVIHIFNSSSSGWQQVQEIWGPNGNALTGIGRITADGSKIFATSGMKNAIYVYESGSSGYALSETIEPDDAATGGKVGRQLEISSDGYRIIASSFKSDSNDGAVYVFESGSSGYTQVQKLTPTTSKDASGAEFGKCMEYSEKVTGGSVLRTIAMSAPRMSQKPLFVFKYDEASQQFVQHQEIDSLSQFDTTGNRGIYVDPQHEWLAAGSSYYYDAPLVQAGRILLYKWSDEY